MAVTCCGAGHRIWTASTDGCRVRGYFQRLSRDDRTKKRPSKNEGAGRSSQIATVGQVVRLVRTFVKQVIRDEPSNVKTTVVGCLEKFNE